MSDEEVIKELGLSEDLVPVVQARMRELGYATMEDYFMALAQDDIVSQSNDDGLLRLLAKLTPEESVELEREILDMTRRRLSGQRDRAEGGSPP